MVYGGMCVEKYFDALICEGEFVFEEVLLIFLLANFGLEAEARTGLTV